METRDVRGRPGLIHGESILFPARQAVPAGSSPRPVRSEDLPQDLPDRLLRVDRPGRRRDLLVLLRSRGGVPRPGRPHGLGHLRSHRHGIHDLHHFGELRPDHRGIPLRRRRVQRRLQAARGEGRGRPGLGPGHRLRADHHDLRRRGSRRGLQLPPPFLGSLQVLVHRFHDHDAYLAQPARREGVRDRPHPHLHGLHAEPHPACPLCGGAPCRRTAHGGLRRLHGSVRRGPGDGVARGGGDPRARLYHGRRDVHGDRGDQQLDADVARTEGKTLNAVLFGKLLVGLWGSGTGEVVVAFVLAAEAALLFVAAQTGFLGGPQVLSNMAIDSFMPHRFAHLSERLVTKYGIYFMGGMAYLMLYITVGSVKYLIIMYSINVFITFSLSQFGMCVHWWKDRHEAQGWKFGLGMNGVGFLLTASILCLTVWIKFPEGGWVTLLITGSFIVASFVIRRHYRKAQGHLRRLDELLLQLPSVTIPAAQEPALRRDAPTAILMVSGYNGLGMHVFFSIVRSFPGTFRNFVFLSAGVIESSTFKGAAEVGNLGRDPRRQLQNQA